MKKKIVFLIPSLSYGGAERVVVTLANSFINIYEVYIIVLYKTNYSYTINEKVRIIYIESEYKPSTSIYSALKSNFIYLQRILSVVKINKIEILISFTTSLNVLTILVSKILKIPNIISERNNPCVALPNLYWKVFRRIAYMFTDKLVIQTQIASSFYERFVSKFKIVIIPNPIDSLMQQKRSFYNERENIILTVGRLDENKNHRLLIEAFSNIKNKNYQLIIVGDGVLRRECEALVSKLGITNTVQFTGNVQNVWDYYNKAKIFAFTSNSEGFPNALLEAFSFGLPCISTDCPSGPSEFIIPNKNGFLIDVNDSIQLKEKLEILMNDPLLRLKFSHNAIIASQQYNIDVIFRKWESLVLELL